MWIVSICAVCTGSFIRGPDHITRALREGNMRRTLILFAIGVSCAIAPTLSAQVALDLGAGYGRGMGGPATHDRNMLNMSSTLAMPLRTGPHGALVVAIAASTDVGMSGVACLQAAGVGCMQFPSLFATAALVGWAQDGDLGRGGRIMAGPSLVNMNDRDGWGAGLMAQADWATPIANRLSFVLSTQGVLPPKWLNSSIGVWSFSAGLRLH